MYIFFCKPKTAYDRRISDWSSDLCSSDLLIRVVFALGLVELDSSVDTPPPGDRRDRATRHRVAAGGFGQRCAQVARKSVVLGQSMSVCVDFGGRRIITKKISLN